MRNASKTKCSPPSNVHKIGVKEHSAVHQKWLHECPAHSLKQTMNKSPVAHSSVWPTSSPESTDFLSGVSLIKIPDLLQKGKKTRFSSSRRCKKAFLHLFSDPLELKYLLKFRKASPGVDWQVSHGPGGFAEAPLFPAAVFLLLNCNLFELNSESKEPLAASAYLVDAKCGCRLSESLTICSFPQPAKTATGVPSYGALFRISPPLESEENTDGDVLITDMQAVFNTEQAQKLDGDSNPRLSERPDMNTCGDQLFTSPYNRIIQLRSSRFFKVSSISFETISSAIAEVYRQERLAASQFDPLAGSQSLTGLRGSIIPSSVSPTSRSVSPQSTTSTNPWLCPVENPERQSALRKMRIITSVSIALSLQVVTCENLAPFLREYLQGVDRGLGSMRLISPENKPYCLAREPSWGQSLRNLAVESDSSAASLEPSVQRSRPATEAQGVGPRPAHLRAALEFPVKNRFYAFNCPRYSFLMRTCSKQIARSVVLWVRTGA
nr:unnamed protein product [Spirometra erinaceieuropaei]